MICADGTRDKRWWQVKRRTCHFDDSKRDFEETSIYYVMGILHDTLYDQHRNTELTSGIAIGN